MTSKRGGDRLSLMAVFQSKAGGGKNKKPAYFHLDNPVFLQPLRVNERVFLFLDLDGSLLEIAATPAEVALSPERRKCLERLTAVPGVFMAVVSGRRIEETQHILQLQGIYYVGLHGLVILTPEGERVSYASPSQEVIAVLRSLKEKFDRSFSEVRGIFLEDKGLALALHFRLAKKEEASEAKNDFVQTASDYQDCGIPLRILHGKQVIEVMPAGMHKGEAVTYLLNRYGNGALPVYIGDDVTDETAFQAVGDRGMSILVTKAPRPTAASFYLYNPAEVEEFLKALVHLREGRIESRL